jgi:hypothetical protein
MVFNFYKNISEELISDLKFPGLYCLRIKQAESLPEDFCHELKRRGHDILYIGQASRSLNRRLRQELLGRGHGTFFRSMGLVLGKMSIASKGRKYNFTFSKSDKEFICRWIKENLELSYFKLDHDLDETERKYIIKYRSLFNIKNNPTPFLFLCDLRQRALKNLTR